MSHALATITASRRPHQVFLVGYEMPARHFDSGVDVLAARRAVYARLHPQTPPVVRSVPPALVKKPRAKIGKPKDHPGVHKAKSHVIIERVAAEHGTTVEDLMTSPLRKHNAVKRIAIYQVVTETGMTFPQVAQVFRYRDHSSVIHHYQRHKAEMAKAPRVARDILLLDTPSGSDQSLNEKCVAVVRQVALQYSITPAQIYGNQRRDDIADARRDVYFKLYTDFGLTLTEVGRQCGNKCHTTIAKALGDLIVHDSGSSDQ